MPAIPDTSQTDISALYVNHHVWLQAWLRRRLGNAWEAADLAQDTFMRLLSAPSASAAQNNPEVLREPRAYLATVARRLLLNHLRRRSLEQAYRDALAAQPEAHAPSPEQQLLVIQALQEIDSMLYGLSPKVRAVFVMSQIEGLPYAEIAEELKIGLRSVKRYMALAMSECILLAA